MSGNAIRDTHGGVFATSRRGGVTNDEIRIAFDLKGKGRSVQHIANYFGRSTVDIHALFQPLADDKQAESLVAIPRTVPVSNRLRKWNPKEQAIIDAVVEGTTSIHEGARLLQTSRILIRNHRDRILTERGEPVERFNISVKPVVGATGEAIAAKVAAKYGFTIAQIQGPGRTRDVSIARHHVMYALKRAGYGHNPIGRFLRRDQSSISTGAAMHDDRMAWANFLFWAGGALWKQSLAA